MKDVTTSTFSEGLIMDLNPLVTPQNCLTDCMNGTLITYNGNEFSLQNDMGNVRIADSEIPLGFIPLGMKEYGGILYLALYNPESEECEIGSIPSPNYDENPFHFNGDGTIKINSSDSITGSSSTSFNFKQMFLKLFEFEQLTLNPGDEYVLGYTINKGVDVFDKIKKPLYSVELYAIDKDNKQHKLDDLNVVKLTNDHPQLIQSDYKYFNHTLSSILALKININNIDWFEAIAYEINDSIKFQFYGKNRLNQPENTADDLYIRGCRINYKNKEIYVGNANNSTDTFNHFYMLNDPSLNKGDLVDFSITPYDQYNYLESLTRKLTIKLGEQYTPGLIENVFKYKYSSENKSFRLDFDMPTLGMVDPYLYLEFYDIWSDYSVIYPIEDINPLGINTVFINTVNEPVVNDYTSTIGGTPKSVIIDYNFSNSTGSNKIYKPFLSNNKIRKNQLLRENNMYVVKISAIDKSTITEDEFKNGIPISKYTNHYKFLIVNENYNDLYESVTSSNVTSNIDFTTQNFNNNISIKLNNDLIEESKIDNAVVTQGDFTVHTTIDGKKYYYKVSDTDNITTDIQKRTETYSKTATYNLSSRLNSVTNSFGEVGLKGYTISDSSMDHMIIDSDQSVKSSATRVVNGNKISFNLFTDRVTTAKITRESKNVPITTNTVTLFSKFYTLPSNEMSAGFKLNGINNWNYPRVVRKTVDNAEVASGSEGVEGTTMKTALAAVGKNGCALNTIGKYDGDSFWLRINENKQTVNKDWFLIFNGDNGDGVGVLYNTKSVVLDILKDLRTSIINYGSKYLFYYSNVDYDKLSKTELKGTIDVTLNSTVTIKQNVKGSSTFEPTTTNTDLINKLNTLFTSRGVSDYSLNNNEYFKLGDSSISIKTVMDIPTLNIERSSSLDLKDRLVESRNDLIENNQELINPTSVPNKTVYSNSGTYDAVAKRFSVTYNGDVPSFYYIPQNLKAATWIVSGNGDKNDGKAFNIDVTQFDIY